MQTNVARLSAKEILDISDYFSTQQAKPARFAADPDPKMIALGAAASKQLSCGNCHSEDYRGTSEDYRGTKDIPRLAGQVPNYLERQMTEFKRGVRRHPAIPAAAETLSDPTIEAI